MNMVAHVMPDRNDEVVEHEALTHLDISSDEVPSSDRKVSSTNSDNICNDVIKDISAIQATMNLHMNKVNQTIMTYLESIKAAMQNEVLATMNEHIAEIQVHNCRIRNLHCQSPNKKGLTSRKRSIMDVPNDDYFLEEDGIDHESILVELRDLPNSSSWPTTHWPSFIGATTNQS